MLKIYKIFSIPILVFIFLANVSFAAVGELGVKMGKHSGEEPPLEYRIEYLAPKGVTSVNEAGIMFDPFFGPPSFLSDDIPEEYFGDYPLYYSGQSMSFRVYIKNLDRRTYRNLLVLTRQELFNKDGGEGEAFGEPYLNEWFIEELAPGEEVVLEGSIKIVGASRSGLDQTHLQILHWPNKNSQSNINGGGQIIVDDPQAGIWCPL